MNAKIRAVAVALSLLTFASAARAQKLSNEVSQALNWMPPQSETLCVARGPVTLPQKGEKGFGSWRDWPISTPYFSISNLQLSIIAPNLPGRVIESSLEARANFRPPAGLGLMLYDGCGLVRLRPLQGENGAALRTRLARGAKKTIVIGGHQTSVFEEKREHDLWRVYVVVPRDNLVIMATQRAFLETVLARMAQKTTRNRAFPSSWNGWKLVDTSAPFWAVRRLDLPQSIGVLGPRDRDRKAVALVIYQDRTPQKPGLILKYRSSNLKYGRRLFETMRVEIHSGLKMQTLAPDVTQITTRGEPQGMVDFFVLGYLGTGIYL